MSEEVLQSLLNRSVAHVRKQGKPSGNPEHGSFRCLYRAVDGSSCAAAPFITAYDTDMEEMGWGRLASNFPDRVEPAAREHAEFVEVLQSAHDSAARISCECDTDFLNVYERQLASNLAAWNARHEETLTVPPFGWEAADAEVSA